MRIARLLIAAGVLIGCADSGDEHGSDGEQGQPAAPTPAPPSTGDPACVPTGSTRILMRYQDSDLVGPLVLHDRNLYFGVGRVDVVGSLLDTMQKLPVTGGSATILPSPGWIGDAFGVVGSTVAFTRGTMTPISPSAWRADPENVVLRDAASGTERPLNPPCRGTFIADPSGIYCTDQPATTGIRRYDPTTGIGTVVVMADSDGDRFTPLATDGRQLYYRRDTYDASAKSSDARIEVTTLDRAGPATRLLADVDLIRNSVGEFDMAEGGAYVRIFDPSGSVLRFVPNDGGVGRTIAATTGYGSIVADGDSFYAADSTTGVRRIRKTDGQIDVLPWSIHVDALVAVDSCNLYAVSNRTLLALPK